MRIITLFQEVEFIGATLCGRRIFSNLKVAKRGHEEILIVSREKNEWESS